MSQTPVEILIVEDNPSDLKLTLHSLQRHKITNRIHTVRDGVEALDFLFRRGAYANYEESSPKVILLDLKLPKVNGLEVLRQLKATPSTASIPVVMLTSSAEDSDIATSYKLGANSYIVKPVDFDKFSESVRQLGLYWLLLNQLPAQV
jgi:CheY-like chemotaxis protein